ncbi:cytochrome bd-I oxidase subunit CydX [Salmonella enterica subsp. enterica]|nr:cytochrome bd-I oxidase subunit CydX [Salmonella enterica subsp. enterica]
MWYFAWILGTLLACAFGIFTPLALERVKRVKPVRRKLMTILSQNCVR